MKAKVALISCFCILWVSAGCNVAIHGTWTPESVTPEGGAKSLTINNVTFKGDDTFAMVSQAGTEKKLSKGTYFFDGFRLKLKTDKGKERVYDCTKVWDKLEIKTAEDGKQVKMVLAKAKTQ